MPEPKMWNFEKGEILNINKPKEWTSFDVVKKIRGMIGVKKVGHAGTLDPFATGVLLICTGKFTKKVDFLMNLDKEYIGTVRLGVRSDTYDITGKLEQITDDLSHISDDKIVKIFEKYTGEIEQRIPPYSAARHKGKRLYELARKGEPVDYLTKKVSIHAIDLLEFKPPYLKIRLRCSRGTYVRTLADDLGRELGVGALLEELERTRIGHYTIEGAWTLEAFQNRLDKIENEV